VLYAPASEVKEAVVAMKVAGGELRTKQVLGQHSSLTIASRTPGYHSEPHKHDCEQLNYVQAGEMWVFVEDTAFHLRTGDFLRIPADAVHWAWNRGDIECKLVEVHTPGLILDGVEATSLVNAEESTSEPVPSYWASTDYWNNEQSALAARGVTR